MNFKFKNSIPDGSYAEVGQTNQLRWVNMFKEEDGSFSYQSCKWKCKDFLNENVRKYQGEVSAIYGYDTTNMKQNDEGMWFHLLYIHDVGVFKKNLGSISKLKGYEPIEVHDYKGDLILFIPRYYFENTYRISVLTYLIRVCNVTEVITDWKNHPTKSIDNTSPTYHDRIIDRGFVEPVKGYWYYVGKMHSPQKKPQTSTVHNCGMNAWMAAADKEGLL